MIGRFVKGGVFVFIDVANIFYSQKTLGWRISYEKLKQYLERNLLGWINKKFWSNPFGSPEVRLNCKFNRYLLFCQDFSGISK
jgi:uncharacterized LabA/DUF88 family protein